MADTQPMFPNRFLRWIFLGPFVLLWKTVSWLCNSIGILLSLIITFILAGIATVAPVRMVGRQSIKDAIAYE